MEVGETKSRRVFLNNTVMEQKRWDPEMREGEETLPFVSSAGRLEGSAKTQGGVKCVCLAKSRTRPGEGVRPAKSPLGAWYPSAAVHGDLVVTYPRRNRGGCEVRLRVCMWGEACRLQVVASQMFWVRDQLRLPQDNE